MAGLSLGSFAATAAAPPSSAGATNTIAQAAYGTGNASPAAGPSTAKNGTIILGIAGAAVILFLYHSLPR